MMPRERARAAVVRSGRIVGTVTAGHVPASPRATTRGSWIHRKWTNRFASGGLRCQPSAALAGGLAAATIRTCSGSSRLPTRRSSTTRSSAACTAGGADESSSKNSSPRPDRVMRTAQSGGAIGTPWWVGSSPTIGSPEKSLGSWMLAMTVSIGRPRPVASCASVADLPMPGSPHSSTGRFAATVSASASAWLLAAGSVRLARVAATRASASASGSGSLIAVALLAGG